MGEKIMQEIASSANISENKVMRQCAQSERVNTPMASGNGKEIISTQAKASVDICGRAVSVVEGQNAPQHQRHEEPRFIQVGEKVSFCTIVEAVLIPSVEDIPQGEKHQRWWHHRDYAEFRKNYARFRRSPSIEDDPDWPEIPDTNVPAVDVTLQAIATDNGTVETYPTPTAGAVLLVDATMADPAVSMTPVHAPNLQSVTLATSGAIENGAQLVRAEGVHQGIEARSRGLQVLPPKNYSDCHLDYYKNKADGRGCYPEYVDHQTGRSRGRSSGQQHGGYHQDGYSRHNMEDVPAYVSSPYPPPVAIAQPYGHHQHSPRHGRIGRPSHGHSQRPLPAQPLVNYNHVHDDRQMYGGVVFGYGPPAVVMGRYGMDYGYFPPGNRGAAVMAPRARQETRMAQPPRYCMWRGPAMFPVPTAHSMQ